MSDSACGALERLLETGIRDGAPLDNDLVKSIDIFESKGKGRSWFIYFALLDYCASIGDCSNGTRRSTIETRSYWNSMVRSLYKPPDLPTTEDKEKKQCFLEFFHCLHIVRTMFRSIHPGEGEFILFTSENWAATESMLSDWIPKIASAYENTAARKLADKFGRVKPEGNCRAILEDLRLYIQERIPISLSIGKQKGVDAMTVRPYNPASQAFVCCGLKLGYLPGGTADLSACSWMYYTHLETINIQWRTQRDAAPKKKRRSRISDASFHR